MAYGNGRQGHGTRGRPLTHVCPFCLSEGSERPNTAEEESHKVLKKKLSTWLAAFPWVRTASLGLSHVAALRAAPRGVGVPWVVTWPVPEIQVSGQKWGETEAPGL